jgi:hypothetical protein
LNIGELVGLELGMGEACCRIVGAIERTASGLINGSAVLDSTLMSAGIVGTQKGPVRDAYGTCRCGPKLERELLESIR